MSDLELIADLIREQHGSDVTAQDLAEIQMFLWERSQDRKLSLIDRGHPDYDDYINADVGKVIGFVVGAALGAFLLPGLGIVAGWVTGALVGGAIGMKLASVFDGPTKLEPAKTPVKTTADPVFGFSGVGGLVTLNTPIPKIYGNRSNNEFGGVKFRDPPRIYTRVYSRQGVRYLESVSVLAFGILDSISLDGIELDDKPRNDFFEEDVLVARTTGNPQQDAISYRSLYAHCQAVAIGTNNYVGIYPALSVDAATGSLSSGTPSSAANAGVFTTGLEVPVFVNYYSNGIVALENNWAAGVRSPYFVAGGANESSIFVQATFLGPDMNAVAQGEVGGAVGISPSGASLFANSEITLEVYGRRINRAGSALTTETGWRLRAYNVEQASGFFTTPNDYSIQIGLTLINRPSARRIAVIFNGQVLFSADTSFAYPAGFHAGYYLKSRGNRMIDPQVRIVANTANEVAYDAPIGSSGYTDSYVVNEDSINKLTSGHIYRGDSTGDLFVVSRNLTTRVVRFSRPFALTALDRVYRAYVSTSKRVNRIEITLKAVISAKNAQGELVEHAEAFSVAISPTSSSVRRSATGVQYSPDGVFSCGQFAIKSKTDQPFITTLEIDNLPLDFYQVTISPLKSHQLVAPVRYLTLASQSLMGAEPSQARIGAAQIQVRAEIEEADLGQLRQLMAYTDKIQLSSEQGPTLQVTHLNEIVYPNSDLNTSIEITSHHGYTLGYTRSIASVRLQNAVTESWDIERGAIVPNYIFAAETVVTSEPTRGDAIGFNKGLPLNGIVRGDIVRVLGVGTVVITDLNTPQPQTSVYCGTLQAFITTESGSATIGIPDDNRFNWALEGMPISAPSLPANCFLHRRLSGNRFVIATEFGERRNALTSGTSTAELNNGFPQVAGREVVIYRMAASNYFPDLYVDRLINPIDGLGNLVDRDHFIHYESIVKSRQFCVRNQFYFDGVVSEGSFEQWATTASPSSLLFCTEIQGRYALIPQETSRANSFLFTDANTISYSEPGVPWHQNLTNTLLVKYQDNLGREKQVKVLTQSAFDRVEPEIIQTISTQGVTSYFQALRVAQVSLKSLRLQNKTCQIITDTNNGLYCIQGDIVRTQHAEIRHDNERSGIVMGTRNFSARYRVAIQTVPIVAINNRFLVASQDIRFRIDNSNTILDEIEITGSPSSDGVYAGYSLVKTDDRSFYIPSATAAGNTPGGALTLYRYFHDVDVQLSEAISIDANSRISICHRSSRITEPDRNISDLSDGWYRVLGVEQEPRAGDAFAIGQSGSFIRYWRIVSIQPDIVNNKVTLAGVLWDDDILTTTGLVVL